MGLPASSSSSATISSMRDERETQIKALRELADSLEKGSALPHVVEGAVSRIVAFRQGMAEVREWREAKARGTAEVISAEEARRILGP
jgi:predicted ATP-dependent protease